MAYTEPTDPSTGELVTAAWWKTDNGDNIRALRLGSLALADQAQYDLVYASSASQWARIVNAASSVLVTSAGKVPSLSQTLPTAVQDLITRVGTIATPITSSLVAPASPVANTLYADSMIKMWAKVTSAGGTPTLVDDVNVSGLVDNDVGNVTVTFATNLPATYGAIANPFDGSARNHAQTWTHAVGSLIVYTYDDASNAAVDCGFCVLAVG